MKYIYKHGNQYWYQRAIPAKLTKILGKKTIKISLKTNKISTALVRSKLQSAEHKKMFNNLLNKKFTINFLKKLIFQNTILILKMILKIYFQICCLTKNK